MGEAEMMGCKPSPAIPKKAARDVKATNSGKAAHLDRYSLDAGNALLGI